MCLFWWRYLGAKGFSVKEGVKGFAYIIALNTVLIGFLVVMIYVTHG
ncbi:MAG: hypothetical protein ACJA0T_003182 [Colwellia sp.]|jgi:hypothetical protein